MKILFMRVLVALVLVGAGTLGPALAECWEGTLPSGAPYRICLPENYNGRLVVFAPGYISPTKEPAIPDDQLILADGYSLPDLVTGFGFAFAVTGYRDTGLVVQEGMEDLKELVQQFVDEVGRPDYVYLAGVSQGGLIAALLAEEKPQYFSGALSCCAAIGDFRRQINYWGDVRVIFDYFFPKVLPGSPVSIPLKLINNWYSFYADKVKAALSLNPHATEQLLAVTRVPPGPTPQTRLQAVLDNLWYNVFGTNDAIDKLGGQPYDNRLRLYSGSEDDLLLNQRVARFQADAAALTEIQKYQTSGRLRIPLVTLHNTQDHVVPYWHEWLYRFKVIAQGSAGRYVHLPVPRWGHCRFNYGEVLVAFWYLLQMVDDAGGRTALPTPEALGMDFAPEPQKSQSR